MDARSKPSAPLTVPRFVPRIPVRCPRIQAAVESFTQPARRRCLAAAGFGKRRGPAGRHLPASSRHAGAPRPASIVRPAVTPARRSRAAATVMRRRQASSLDEVTPSRSLSHKGRSTMMCRRPGSAGSAGTGRPRKASTMTRQRSAAATRGSRAEPRGAQVRTQCDLPSPAHSAPTVLLPKCGRATGGGRAGHARGASGLEDREGG